MPTYLDWRAPLGTTGSAGQLRAALYSRVPYGLASSASLQDITVVDPEAGSMPVFITQNGRLFELDALDTTTAHDGTTCLVSADGKRYKVVSFDYPFSVLDKDLTAPPDSPEASVGDAYIVGVASTDDWSGKDNQVAVMTERGWQFATIPIGKLVYVEDETGFYHRNASGTWTAGIGSLALGAGVVKPSSLIGGGGRVHWIVENQTTTAPPGSVTNGVAYIIGASATGDWSGHDAKIAHGEGGAWVIYEPDEGWTAYDKALDRRLIYTGTGWLGGSDGLVLIETKTASSSPYLDFLLPSSITDQYDYFELVLCNIKPETNDVEAWLRVGTGSPSSPTYQSADYDWISTSHVLGSSPVSTGSGSASKIVMSRAYVTWDVGSGAGRSFNAAIRFRNPESTDYMAIGFEAEYIHADTVPGIVSVSGKGVYMGAAGGVTAIRFMFESGNIAAGTASLYARNK